jgi:DNA repair protein RadD
VLTHRREILKQTSYKVSGSNLDHGLIQAGLNADPEHPIQIASIQTLHARCMRTDKMSLPAANLIIVDEAHHIAARTWDAIFSAYPNAARIGLTATRHAAVMVVGSAITSRRSLRGRKSPT